MNRLFIPKEQISGKQISILGADVNYLKNVLRLEIGESLEVFDSTQKVYLTKLSEIRKNEIILEIIKEEQNEVESKIKVTLAIGLPKGKKMDTIVRQATELGVYSIIPVISERSIPKIEEKEDKKIAHWQAIAKEAAEQSGRVYIPEIHPLVKLTELSTKEYDLAIVPWEGEKNKKLDHAINDAENIIVVVGPEGGFSKHEIDQLSAKGFSAITLGKRILRVDTAVISTLALLLLNS